MSTEQLAHRMGTTYGALFNATFGNFAEMIIAIFAIRAGLPDVVRASLSGSILGNLLFVAGLSMLVGGWNRDTIKFNALSAESPRLRYPVGKGVVLSRLRRFVPAGMFDRSLRKQFQLD